MSLQLYEPREARRALRARVQLRAGVNTNVAHELAVNLKPHPTLLALVRSVVGVEAAEVHVQVVHSREALGTDGAAVRPVGLVDFHVTVQRRQLREHTLAHVALIYSLLAVGPAVLRQVARPHELLSADRTPVRPLSGMRPPVRRQMVSALKTFPALQALEFACMRVHMTTECNLGSEHSAALRTRICLFSAVFSHVSIQITFRRELFATHRTQMRSWHVVVRMLDNIITIGFSLYLKATLCMCSTTNMRKSHTPNKC